MELLPYINVFLPNEEEAKKISNKTDVMEAGEWLAKLCQIVENKRGKDGATIFKDKFHFHTDVPQEIGKNLNIADTTGAGDNFNAGFLREWLQGKPLKVCGTTAVKCGMPSLSEIGGIGGQSQENL